MKTNELEEKFYLIRSYSGGVWYGNIKSLERDVCILKNARNIWNWTGASCLVQIAQEGIASGKVSAAIDDPEGVYITQVCNILPMTGLSVEKLNAIPAWKI
jgi:hypothetical protein